MGNTEILQQEKQEIFATTKLKTIIPKTPEEKERIENIKEKIIDIEIYKGLIHHTLIPYIENILIEGLIRGESARKSDRWAYGGILKKQLSDYNHTDAHTISLTFYKNNTSSFRKWESIRFENAGHITLLFNPHKVWEEIIYMEEANYFYNIDRKKIMLMKFQDYYLQALDLNYSRQCDWPEKRIDSSCLSGIVFSPKNSILEVDKKQKYQNNLEKRTFVQYTPVQKAEILTNRLTRLFYKKPDAHLVPLYDHLGNVLWPEKISYQEVQKIVLQRKN